MVLAFWVCGRLRNGMEALFEVVAANGRFELVVCLPL